MTTFLYSLNETIQQVLLLRLVIEVFYNKCSSIFVHNWLILIRDTIMCKKSKNKSKQLWMQYDCYNYAKYFMYGKYLYICAFNNNSAILTLQF